MVDLRVNQCFLLVVLLIICGIQYVMFTLVFKRGVSFDKFIGLRGGALNSISDKITGVDPSPNEREVELTVKFNRTDNIRTQVQGKPPGHEQARIAVILPYLGKSLPSWFDLFALSAMGSSSLVDWYIFITEAPRRSVPPNVHLVRLTRQDMFQRLSRLDSVFTNTSSGRQKLEEYFQFIIDVHPYILVEMKPALGFLFGDYVSDYSHWAYADLDLLVGRLHHQITPDLLHKYDIITLSFGDNNRLYMRGQFTVHKNTPALTNLWQRCDYLSKIGPRVESFFNRRESWDFHSAEGCYSKVVADTPSISVLYAPVQFSDAFRAPLEAKETIVVGSALQRCYEHSIPEAVLSASYAPHAPVLDTLRNVPAVGVSLERVAPGTERCEYWIDPRDQVCTQYVAGNATITIENGKMTARTEARFAVDGCREASIAHFQGGKRGYFHFTTRLPPASAHAMVITDSGVVPLRLSYAGAKPFSETFTPEAVLAGRLRHYGAQTGGDLFSMRTAHLRDIEEPTATAYCIGFSEDLKKCSRFLYQRDITLLAVPTADAPSVSPVTMITVGWLHEYVTGVYAPLLDSWIGTTVLVLAVACESDISAFAHHRSDVTILAVYIGDIGDGNKSSTLHLPDKTLYNIGLDAARSEVVLLVPNNMHFNASEQTRADLRHLEPLLHQQGSPVAIIIPAQSRATISTGESPSYRAQQAPACGSDTPHDLMLPRGRMPFAFHAQELLKQHTIMLPVLFNTSASPHGSGFVRFPEELNGVGCYDVSIIRVLGGAGYRPQWPPHGSALRVESSRMMSSARQAGVASGGEEFEYKTECRCMSSSNPAKVADMVSHMNRFFLKAVELRNFGLEKVFSKEPFGRNFDEDQLKN